MALIRASRSMPLNRSHSRATCGTCADCRTAQAQAQALRDHIRNAWARPARQV